MVPGDLPHVRVLLIEDSRLLAGRIQELLRRLPGVELLGVAEGEADAIKLIGDLNPDALILDLHLRQGSGFGVLRYLSGATHRPRVIILTNHDVAMYRSSADAFGVAAYLDKVRDYGRLPTLLLDFARELSQRGRP